MLGHVEVDETDGGGCILVKLGRIGEKERESTRRAGFVMLRGLAGQKKNS
jgi:hypothetical protein